jgi:hypothetical protein
MSFIRRGRRRALLRDYFLWLLWALLAIVAVLYESDNGCGPLSQVLFF